MGTLKKCHPKSRTQTQPASTSNNKKAGKKIKTNFGVYISRIQKKADSKVRISVKALQTVDGMITNLIEEFGTIIGELKRKTKSATLSPMDIKAAIKLKCQDGELAKHCIKEGSNAVMKFQKK